MQTVQIENLQVTLGTGEENMQDAQLSTPLREGIKVKELKCVPIRYLNYRFRYAPHSSRESGENVLSGIQLIQNNVVLLT